MKKLVFLSLLLSLKVMAAPILNLDVADQNFNSTEKIVIDQEEIRKSRANDLPSLLESKANISVSGNNMQPSAIFIRGGDSGHVLILVDGVPTYDASTAQRTLNLFAFDLSKVRRVEILKGSQSVMYGGQALAGVIKISTIDEKNPTSGSTVALEAGASRDKVNRGAVYANTSTKISDSLYLLGNAYGVDEQNFSPVVGSDVLYPTRNYGAGLGLFQAGAWSNLVKLTYSNERSEINDANPATGLPADSQDFESTAQNMGVAWKSNFNDNISLVSTYQKSNRVFYQSASNILFPNPSMPGDMDWKIKGDLFDSRLDAKLYKNDQFNLIGGLQFTNEKIEEEMIPVPSSIHYLQGESAFVKAEYSLSKETKLEAGYRYMTEKLEELAQSYQVGLTKELGSSIVRLEYSTGFKVPSLFQLYGGMYGNPNLKPENSKNVSMSFDHKFTESFFGSISFFNSYYDDLIIYKAAGAPGSGNYQNIAKSKTEGVEISSQIGLIENWLKLSLAAGYQEPRDLTKNAWLLRRSLRSASARLTFNANDNTVLGLEGVHVGSKMDSYAGVNHELEAYTLMNISFQQKLTNWNSIYARVDNVFGTEYQNAFGYLNKGYVAKLGTEFSF